MKQNNYHIEDTTREEIILSCSLSKYDDRFYLYYNRKAFIINECFYDLISYQKNGMTHNEALEQLKKTSNFTSESDISNIERHYIRFIQDIKTKTPSKKYIKFRIVIFSKDKAQKIGALFSSLFNKKIFTTLFISALIINLYFVFFKGVNSIHFNISTLWVLFIASLSFLLFHEVGHSAAAVHFRIEPEEIGLGFYYIIPVFYSDVTKIWLLNKTRRIIVNLGGVYFQLLLNVVMIALFVFFSNQSEIISNILIYLILANGTSICYSIIPFFRNDGYWIYSDIFNIHNLLKVSDEQTARFICNLLSKRKKPIDKRMSLYIYSISNFAFRSYIFFSAIKNIQTRN